MAKAKHVAAAAADSKTPQRPKEWYCWPEWLTEWAVFQLRRVALFSLLEYVGKFGLLLSIVLFLYDYKYVRPDRELKERYDTARTGAGQFRIRALETLVRERHPLYGIELTYGYFKDAQLTGADFSDARLGRTYFEHADFSRARLVRATMNDAVLIDAILTDASLSDATLTGANLARANLQGAHLYSANLTRTHAYGIRLCDAVLLGANLSYANLSDADLRGAEFTNAILEGAKLQGAKLQGANLELAVDLTVEQIENSFIDDKTRLPANFREQLEARRKAKEKAAATPDDEAVGGR